MKKFLADYLYSSLILLMMMTIVMCWIPLRILGIFFGKKFDEYLAIFFLLFDGEKKDKNK